MVKILASDNVHVDLKVYYKNNFSGEIAYIFPLNNKFYATNLSISFPNEALAQEYINNLVKEGKVKEIPQTLYPILDECFLTLAPKSG
jgi:hypothetical protein